MLFAGVVGGGRMDRRAWRFERVIVGCGHIVRLCQFSGPRGRGPLSASWPVISCEPSHLQRRFFFMNPRQGALPTRVCRGAKPSCADFDVPIEGVVADLNS